MQQKDTAPIYEPLSAPLETLGFSEALLHWCKRRKFQQLADIIALGSEKLVADTAIEPACFTELIQFLRKRMLLHLLESKAK